MSVAPDLPEPEPRARRSWVAWVRGRARPSLFDHPKFRRLVDELGMPLPHVLGHLEFLRHSAYARYGEPLGDARDVEFAAEWRGESGLFAEALWRNGFIDDVGGATPCFRVHDLYEHAPDAVKKRLDRAAVRRELGVTLHQRRQASARARWRRRDLARDLTRLARWEEKHASDRRLQPFASSEVEATEPEGRK